MTRDEKIAEATRLRAEGLSYAAVGRALGASGACVQKWLKPEWARECARRDNARRGPAKRAWEDAYDRGRCPCGAPTGVGAARHGNRGGPGYDTRQHRRGGGPNAPRRLGHAVPRRLPAARTGGAMSFVCSIHGYYTPPPGATIAICPSCSSQTYVSIAANQRVKREDGAIRADAVREVVAWIRREYAAGAADATYSYYALALADDIERSLLP